MEKGKSKKFDLGADGEITCHLSADYKRLLIEFATIPQGLSKAGVNGLIDSLKKVRERMVR